MRLVKLELNGTIPHSTKNRKCGKGTIHKDKKIWIGAEELIRIGNKLSLQGVSHCSKIQQSEYFPTNFFFVS